MYSLLVGGLLACGAPRGLASPRPNPSELRVAELETPAGHVRLDACGECPAPYVCYLDPLADLRSLPGSDHRPADVFECSRRLVEGPNAELLGLSKPPPPRSCAASRQRYWLRNGRRFVCCLFEAPVSVECRAE